MSRRFYIETTARGGKQIVSVKRSRSQSKHHHDCHRPIQQQEPRPQITPEHYKVRVDEWNRVKERGRSLEETNSRLAGELEALRETNSRLAGEVEALKDRLASAEAEANNLGKLVVPELQSQISVLTTGNEALEKTLKNACKSEDKHGREEEKLQQKIDKLEKERNELKDENSSLREKVKNTQRHAEKVSDWPPSETSRVIPSCFEISRYWRKKYDDTKQQHEADRATLESRTMKMRAYEDILKRRGII